MEKVPGYEPSNEAITIARLGELAGAYQQKMDTVHEISASLSHTIKHRKHMFDENGGVKEKMKLIKRAVKAQYGGSSAEYESVK